MEELRQLLRTSRGKQIFVIGHDNLTPTAEACVSLFVVNNYKAHLLNNMYILSQFTYPFGFYHLINLYANEGDFVIIFSQTGISKSLTQACHAANMKKCKTITFVGEDGGLFKRYQQNLNIYKVFHIKDEKDLVFSPYELIKGLEVNASTNPDNYPM